MLDVLAITGPIFLAALLGFATTRAGLFAKADMRVFGKFVVNIALPALLYNALSQRPIGDVLNGGYLVAYLAGSLALLGAGYAWGHRAARLAANPLLIAIAGGIAVSALGWKLPAAVARTVDLFALSSSALSLFVIGGTLVALPMRGLGRKVVPIAIGKLMLHPLVVGLAVFALPALGMPALDPSLRAAAVLTAAVPMMGIYPIFAQAYGHEDVGAASMLVATVASFFTLSRLLWMFTNHPGVF